MDGCLTGVSSIVPLPPPPRAPPQYAELPPAPLQTTPEAEALFEKKATEVSTIKCERDDPYIESRRKGKAGCGEGGGGCTHFYAWP